MVNIYEYALDMIDTKDETLKDFIDNVKDLMDNTLDTFCKKNRVECQRISDDCVCITSINDIEVNMEDNEILIDGYEYDLKRKLEKAYDDFSDIIYEGDYNNL